MVTGNIIVPNPSGLHVRPAGEFAKVAKTCSSNVTIIFNEKEVNGKSPVNILMVGIKCGDEITISCSGDDEEKDLQTLLDTVRSGLGERLVK